MVYDPVCKGEVDEKSVWYSTYQGRTYFFTSEDCKTRFDREPGTYAPGQGGIAEVAEAGIREARGQAASRARIKLRSMISEQKQRAAVHIGAMSNAFRTASDRLRDQNQETMAGYADSAAANVDRISGYLQQHDAEEIISSAENFIRRRPGLVIASAFAAGFLTARFLKGSGEVSA